MRSWSPEPFDEPGGAAAPAVVRARPAEEAGERLFRREGPDARPDGLLDLLTPEERAEVRQAVENELAAEAEARRREELAEHDAIAERRLAALAEQLEARRRESLALLMRQTTELAVAMAEQIVRHAVAADRDALVRVLETVLYKAEAGARLGVTASPPDAAFLQARPDLCQRLGLAEIKADRRVEPGGCLVRADGREWDATVRGQLEVLAELAGQALAAAPPQEDADDGERGLE